MVVGCKSGCVASDAFVPGCAMQAFSSKRKLRRLIPPVLVASRLGADEGVRPSKRKGRLASRPSESQTSLQHLHAGHFDGVFSHRSGDRDVVSFVSLQGVLIVNSQDLLV